MKTLRTLLAACLLAAALFAVPAAGQVPTSTARPGVYVAKTLFVDATYGSNSTAAKYRMDKPYSTLTAALSAAGNGELVIIRRGTYNERLILKDGVNLQFDTGANITYTGSLDCVTDNGSSVTCTIAGLTMSLSGSGGAYAIAISNASSNVSIDAVTISNASASGGGVSLHGGILHLHCKSLSATGGVGVTQDGGTLYFSADTVSGAGSALYIDSGGVADMDVGTVSGTSISSALVYFGGSAYLRFRTLSDSGCDGFPVLVCAGTATVQGGNIHRGTTGNAVQANSGTLNLLSADITGSFGGGTYAIQALDGTVNVFPGARYDATKSTGTLTFAEVYGVAPTSTGIALLSALDASAGRAALGLIKADYIYIEDRKSAGTNGGTFTSGAWQTRDLNTIVSDTAGICTLGSNQFTLPAGTYRFRASCPAGYCGRHRARLYNVTDSSVTAWGKSEYAGPSNTSRSEIEGRFTIASSKTFRIEHYAQTTAATEGFGSASQDAAGTEVYSSICLIVE